MLTRLHNIRCCTHEWLYPRCLFFFKILFRVRLVKLNDTNAIEISFSTTLDASWRSYNTGWSAGSDWSRSCPVRRTAVACVCARRTWTRSFARLRRTATATTSGWRPLPPAVPRRTIPVTVARRHRRRRAVWRPSPGPPTVGRRSRPRSRTTRNRPRAPARDWTWPRPGTPRGPKRTAAPAVRRHRPRSRSPIPRPRPLLRDASPAATTGPSASRCFSRASRTVAWPPARPPRETVRRASARTATAATSCGSGTSTVAVLFATRSACSWLNSIWTLRGGER